jgi:ABC-type sugar transport system permease subunit
MKRIEKRKEQLFILELLLPALILIGFFIVFPLYRVFQMSFTNWDLMRAAEGNYFLGWQNF